MAEGFIPRPDIEFQAWQDNFFTYAAANLAALGLVAGDLTALLAAQNAWKTAYSEHNLAVTAALAARATKDAARAEFEALIRPFVRRLQASPQVDNGERGNLGITIPGGPGAPSGPPTGIPLLKVECERLRHTLRWTDSATPTSRAKPPGVMGLEIRVALTAIGAPTPTDPDAFQFIALDTATPYVKEFDAADGGKNAHYMCRWVNNANEHGPWSETVSVTVGA